MFFHMSSCERYCQKTTIIFLNSIVMADLGQQYEKSFGECVKDLVEGVNYFKIFWIFCLPVWFFRFFLLFFDFFCDFLNFLVIYWNFWCFFDFFLEKFCDFWFFSKLSVRDFFINLSLDLVHFKIYLSWYVTSVSNLF